MKAGSIGEIPPRTRVTAGFASSTAFEAHFTIAAYISHSGSISKSQWDLLFGSFQNMMASTGIDQRSLIVCFSRFAVKLISGFVPAEKNQGLEHSEGLRQGIDWNADPDELS